MRLNCFDASFRSFEQKLPAELDRRGIAALEMKSFGRSGKVLRQCEITPREALSYAPSGRVTISDIDTLEVLRQNLEIACGFCPLSASAMQSLRERCRPVWADGHNQRFYDDR